MKAVSVYDYGGGFRLGAERVGITTLVKRELPDAFGKRSVAQVSLNLETPDIKAAPFEDWGKMPKVDLVYGNPPCAAFSTKGYGAGAASHYADRWRELATVAAQVKPKWTVLESVEQASRRYDGIELVRSLRDQIDPKAVLHHVVVNARDVGSAQHRRRYFAVIARQDFSPSWPTSPPQRTVRQVIGKVPKDNMLTVDRGGHNLKYWPYWEKHGLNDSTFAGGLDNQYAALFELFLDNGGEPERFERPFILRRLLRGETRLSSGYAARRLGWDQASPVILSDSPRLLLHPAEMRGITIREAYLLMGFPATWKLGETGGGEGLAMQASNGVTVDAGAFVLSGLGQVDGYESTQTMRDTREVWHWSPWGKVPPIAEEAMRVA